MCRTLAYCCLIILFCSFSSLHFIRNYRIRSFSAFSSSSSTFSSPLSQPSNCSPSWMSSLKSSADIKAFRLNGAWRERMEWLAVVASNKLRLLLWRQLSRLSKSKMKDSMFPNSAWTFDCGGGSCTAYPCHYCSCRSSEKGQPTGRH